MARVLVTNDDGVDSPGIMALAAVAAGAGHDVVIAAPSWDSSGASASLTAALADGRLILDRRSDDALPDVKIFAVEAAPAFIVRAAATGAFGPPPDVVLSGINIGPNTGHAALHSGTVGAALTGSTTGARAAAFSIGVGNPIHWATATRVAEQLLASIVDGAAQLVLNVNVPNVAPQDLTGMRAAHLATIGAVQAVLTETGEGYVKLDYEALGGELEPGTDVAVLADGAASVTALRAVCEAADVDVEGMLDALTRIAT
jgi:5'-nucleotidase